MVMMLLTAGLLFAVGFAAGYGLRAAISAFRRSKLRKQRADDDVNRALNKTAPVGTPSAQMAGPGAAAVSGQANA
jgi:uncharacterized membrane protein YciS (DUF1049 family)